MQIEREPVPTVESHQRTADRQGYANGLKPKTLKTRVGRVDLRIPQTRDDRDENGRPFHPRSLERGVCSQRAMARAVTGVYVQGVSTRKITAIGSLLKAPRGIKPVWLVMLTAGAVAWGTVDRSQAAEPPPDMQRVADGVRYGRRTTTDPRPLEIHVLEVDLTSPRVALEAVVADDPDGDGPAEATLVDPERLTERPGIVAAVNANAFRGLPDASGTASKHWKLDMPVTIAGWARTPDGDASLPDCDFAQFWIDATGRARIGGADAPWRHGATTAVAGFHVILANGRPLTGYKEKLHPRTIVGTDATGTTVWLVVVDGRRPGISEGMTYRELAALMQDLGCVDALNLDGGGSSVMLTAGPTGGLEIVNRPSGRSTRPVPVMLAVRAARAQPQEPTR